MKLGGNTVKSAESGATQITYSQQGGFPTIAPAPQQGHQGIMSTHQGQFQVISSPPFATSAQAQNAATAQYIPQFASYNQQGQLVISPANFPASAYGQQQFILTAAPGVQQAQQSQQQAAQQQQQVQQQQAAQQQQAQAQAGQGGGPSGHQGGSTKGLLTTAQGNKQSATLVPMSQHQGFTIAHNGLVQNNNPGQPTFMFTNSSPLMTASQPGLLTSLSSNEAKNDSSKQGQGLGQQNTAGAPTAQAQAPPGSLIMHNGMAYMNPQHQQAILSSNGQIILRAPTTHETAQQQIMFSPSHLTQQGHIHSPTASNQQQAQQQAGQQISMAPPTLQPMSLNAATNNGGGTIRHVTSNSNNVSTQSGAPPGKTAISRALPTILPTSNARPTYTLPQTPISQASLQVNHHQQQQQPSPKSKNKFSPRGGMGSGTGRQPGPGKINNSGGGGGGTANSILKPSMVQHRATPPGTATATIVGSPQSPRAMGPPVLSQQQPPVNSHSQPPTLQPMLSVANAASGGVSTNPPQLHMQYPPVLAASSSPSSASSGGVLVVTTSSSTSTSSKVLSTSSSKGKPSGAHSLIKAKPPPSTPPPPPVSVSASSNTTSNGVTENGSGNNNNSSSGGSSDTPKAFVKPNVLTHVIDGHIIQESSQPFPLEAGDDKGRNRGGGVTKKESTTEESSNHSNSSSNNGGTGGGGGSLGGNNNNSSSSSSGGSTTTTTTTTTSSSTKSNTSSTNSSGSAATGTHVEKKRGPGRPPGSTRQNIDSQRIPGSENSQSGKGNNHHIKDGGPPSEKRRKLDDSIIKPPPLPSPNSVFGKNGNPLKWSVQQVCDFVKSLHGCAEYVEDFMLQEIDGQALMLLKTEHLMAAMSIKLGPALKICSAINEMREETKQN